MDGKTHYVGDSCSGGHATDFPDCKCSHRYADHIFGADQTFCDGYCDDDSGCPCDSYRPVANPDRRAEPKRGDPAKPVSQQGNDAGPADKD